MTSKGACCLLVERRSVMGENRGTIFDMPALEVMLANLGVLLHACLDAAYGDPTGTSDGLVVD